MTVYAYVYDKKWLLIYKFPTKAPAFLNQSQVSGYAVNTFLSITINLWLFEELLSMRQ